MPILSPSDAARVREMLADSDPVRLVFFTRRSLRDVRAHEADPRRGGRVERPDHRRRAQLPARKDTAAGYGIDRVPPSRWWAKDYRIRFLGIPSGYEFMSLIDAIKMVSAGDSGLSEPSRALLAHWVTARASGVRHPP